MNQQEFTEEVSAELRKDIAERKDAENNVESLLRDYIENTDRHFPYGGVVNLLTTIAAIMADKSQLEGDDY